MLNICIIFSAKNVKESELNFYFCFRSHKQCCAGYVWNKQLNKCESMYSLGYFRIYLKRQNNFLYMYKEKKPFKFCEKSKKIKKKNPKKRTHLKGN